jgi:N-acetylmuramoyl-L-alanine amidase
MNPRPLQQGPLRVLVGANMPAVLVEIGFLSNPQQETELASDAYQNNVVQGIVDAVVQFRDSRGVTARPLAPVPQVTVR